MNKKYEIDINNLKNNIKAILQDRGFNLTACAREVAKKEDKNERSMLSTYSTKLESSTLRVTELVKLLEVAGLRIEVVEK